MCTHCERLDGRHIVARWFAELTANDQVSVKPHVSPVLHAINYHLGDLDESYLSTLRVKGGLQSYPPRLKDPDTVDFSTGSVAACLVGLARF